MNDVIKSIILYVASKVIEHDSVLDWVRVNAIKMGRWLTVNLKHDLGDSWEVFELALQNMSNEFYLGLNEGLDFDDKEDSHE